MNLIVHIAKVCSKCCLLWISTFCLLSPAFVARDLLPVVNGCPLLQAAFLKRAWLSLANCCLLSVVNCCPLLQAAFLKRACLSLANCCEEQRTLFRKTIEMKLDMPKPKMWLVSTHESDNMCIAYKEWLRSVWLLYWKTISQRVPLQLKRWKVLFLDNVTCKNLSSDVSTRCSSPPLEWIENLHFN